jgi:hypothetical protein
MFRSQPATRLILSTCMINESKDTPRALSILVARRRKMQILTIDPSAFIRATVDERKLDERKLPARRTIRTTVGFAICIAILVVLAWGATAGLTALLYTL